MDDVFTSADTKAQAIYLRAIQECFPDYGFIGEEDGLVIRPKNGCTIWVTVDPLDGTKAFVRRQSDGVGSMVAVIDGNEVISVYIGDINTNEVYGYRPGSDTVWRISEFDSFEKLGYAGGDDLSKRYVLLRDPPEDYSSLSRRTLDHFKSYEVRGSSIGIWAARLWKREVSALLIQPGWETPWDSNPVFGISQKLGYVFLRPYRLGDEADSWEVYDQGPLREKQRRAHDILIVHKLDLPQLGAFMQK